MIMTADEAIDLWKNSPAHRSVILNEGQWADKKWGSFGAAMTLHYAVAWYGDIRGIAF
jgi:uncharacterized protein YkwD